jgi:predicted Fe-Mo cluster-binding NifX family protein
MLLQEVALAAVLVHQLCLPVELMVKAAFASWNDRIAPVFDVARWIQLVEIEAGQIISQNRARVACDMPNQKASRLAELEVGILVCGAISRPMQAIIKAYGIEVIPFITGDLQEVIQAWQKGQLSAAYTMPGCARRQRQQLMKGMNGRQNMNTGNRQGTTRSGRGAGPGRAERQGQKGMREGQRGRRGRTMGSDPIPGEGACVCPQCGHREPHTRAVPCKQTKCARCGAVMTRQPL